MVRKKNASTAGLGRALANAQERRVNDPKHRDAYKQISEGVKANLELQKASILEATTLDDFLALAEKAKTDFTATRGKVTVVAESVIPKKLKVSSRPDRSDMIVPIPRRPAWTTDLTKEELQQLENDGFVTWRKQLAEIEEDLGCTMTPFERNLDFWRQLWRVVEKSDLLVQIVDARDPLFYRSIDLEKYVKEIGENKEVIILLNKVDYLPRELREEWVKYFEDQGVRAICFSALKELEKLGDFVNPERRALNDDDDADGSDESDEEPVAVLGDEYDPTDVLDVPGLIAHLQEICPVGKDRDGADHQTIGFVGYPNVGKSTVINALFGKKKASMSRQPGKTRHFQTLELTSTVTLCDCPGLVMPKVVATKAHLVINNTMSVDRLRNFHEPCQLIADRVGLLELYRRYGVPLRPKLKKVGDFLEDFAKWRGHFLRLRVPDEKWSARRVMHDYVVGRLLFCETPRGEIDYAPSIEEQLNRAAGIEKKKDEDGNDDDDASPTSIHSDNFASDFEFELDGAPKLRSGDEDGDNKKQSITKTKRANRRDKKFQQLQRVHAHRKGAEAVF